MSIAPKLTTIQILPFLSKNNILSLSNFAEKETSEISFANFCGFFGQKLD